MMYLIIVLMSHTHVTICGVTQQTSMACTSSQHQSSIALMVNSTYHKKTKRYLWKKGNIWHLIRYTMNNFFYFFYTNTIKRKSEIYEPTVI